MPYLKKTFFIVFVLTSLGIAFKPAEKGEKPNIVLILADDLGYGDLGVQGATDIKTPHIDEMAHKGMTFTNFYANSTVCSPSRAALLSGRYPDMVGVPGVIRQNTENSWGNLVDNTVLMPQVLKTAGYNTALIGKWHLGLENPDIPNDKGFDFFKGFLGDMMDDYWTHRRGDKNWMRLNQKEIDPAGHATEIFTDWAVAYLQESKKKKKPFFLFLAYNAPHFPIQPPQEWLEKVTKREVNSTPTRAKNVAFVEHLDHHVGKVLQAIKSTGLADNTLIIFTSDNGGALNYAQSNGKLRGGKQDMYEGGIRVPTFFFWKNNIEANTKSDFVAMHTDLLPTLCEVAGLKKTATIDGTSILPTLLGKNQATPNRTLFWVRREGGTYNGLAYYAARYKNYKLVQNTPFEPTQLFDIVSDPYETNPVQHIHVKEFQYLKSELQEHIRKTGSVPWQ